jgi:hypothetical protein
VVRPARRGADRDSDRPPGPGRSREPDHSPVQRGQAGIEGHFASGFSPARCAAICANADHCLQSSASRSPAGLSRWRYERYARRQDVQGAVDRIFGPVLPGQSGAERRFPPGESRTFGSAPPPRPPPIPAGHSAGFTTPRLSISGRIPSGRILRESRIRIIEPSFEDNPCDDTEI